MPALSCLVLVMAMEAEAAPLRARLDLSPAPTPSWARHLPGRVWFSPGRHRRPAVLLATAGTDPATGVDCIGSTAAGLTTQLALSASEELTGAPPDLVLSVGTAGGWQRDGTQVGDVFLAWDRFVSHDRRIDLPGFDALALGNLPAADLRHHAEPLGCRLGSVTTGDSLDESPEDAARIRASGAAVKEMEAAAVAWVASLHGRPVSAVKAVTDLVDSPVPTGDQFLANLARATGRLADVTVALIDRLAMEED